MVDTSTRTTQSRTVVGREQARLLLAARIEAGQVDMSMAAIFCSVIADPEVTGDEIVAYLSATRQYQPSRAILSNDEGEDAIIFRDLSGVGLRMVAADDDSDALIGEMWGYMVSSGNLTALVRGVYHLTPSVNARTGIDQWGGKDRRAPYGGTPLRFDSRRPGVPARWNVVQDWIDAVLASAGASGGDVDMGGDADSNSKMDSVDSKRSIREPLIRDCYFAVLDAVLHEHNLQPRKTGYVVHPETSLRRVVLHTDHFLRSGDTQPYYRYNRYRPVLENIQPSNRRQAHVDIGCGAGLFSWVFLDWAKENNLAYDRIDLYGLDHSPEMIQMAYRMRGGLAPHIANYPPLRYTDNDDALLQLLKAHHREATDYTITFGHVLVQASQHTPQAIPGFARVIAHIVGMMDAESQCVAMAVDASRNDGPAKLAQSWNGMMNALGKSGIQRDPVNVPNAKIARLSPARRQYPANDTDDLPF